MKCWVCNTELIWGGDHDLEQEPDYDPNITFKKGKDVLYFEYQIGMLIPLDFMDGFDFKKCDDQKELAEFNKKYYNIISNNKQKFVALIPAEIGSFLKSLGEKTHEASLIIKDVAKSKFKNQQIKRSSPVEVILVAICGSRLWRRDADEVVPEKHSHDF